MRPIGEFDPFVVSGDILDARSLRPREDEQLALALKVVFHMAVAAHDGPHLLAGERAPVFPLGFERGLESRVGDDELHRVRFMAIGAADGIDDSLTQRRERRLVKLHHPEGAPQARVVGALA